MPSSLGILASENEVGGGGGLEQGEMAEMVSPLEAKLQFAWQQWHGKREPGRETPGRNRPRKTGRLELEGSSFNPFLTVTDRSPYSAKL